MILNVPSQMNNFVSVFREMNTHDSTLGQMAEAIMTEVTDFLQNWMRTDLMARINDLMSGLRSG